MREQDPYFKALFVVALLCLAEAAVAAQTAYECTGTSTVVESDGTSESINQKSHAMKVVLDLDRKVRVLPDGRTTPLEAVKNIVIFTDLAETRAEPSGKSTPAMSSKMTRETTIDIRSGSYMVSMKVTQLTEGKKYTLDSQTNGSCKTAPVAGQ